MKFWFFFITGKNLKTRFEKKKIVIRPRQVPQLDPGNYMQWTSHSVQWPQECPPNTHAGPLPVANWSYNCMEISTSSPNWLDQGRASELSCGRGTERVLDRYPLQL